MDYKLKRYNLHSVEGLSGLPMPIEDNSAGVWVKWEDVEPLIKAYLALINDRNRKTSSVTEIEGIE